MLRIEVTGLKQVANKLERLGADARRLGTLAVAEVALEVERKAKEDAPFRNRTGTLRRSIHTEMTSEFEATVKPATPYAVYVEYGTKPHKIRIRTPHGERVINHPGSKPYPYMKPAYEHGREFAKDVVNRMVEQMIRGL